MLSSSSSLGPRPLPLPPPPPPPPPPPTMPRSLPLSLSLSAPASPALTGPGSGSSSSGLRPGPGSGSAHGPGPTGNAAIMTGAWQPYAGSKAGTWPRSTSHAQAHAVPLHESRDDAEPVIRLGPAASAPTTRTRRRRHGPRPHPHARAWSLPRSQSQPLSLPVSADHSLPDPLAVPDDPGPWSTPSTPTLDTRGLAVDKDKDKDKGKHPGADADAVVVLPHHGHPHCGATESGSPLVGFHAYWMAAAHTHAHRPIVLHDLVSSLSSAPAPAPAPAPPVPGTAPMHVSAPPSPTLVSSRGVPRSIPVGGHPPPVPPPPPLRPHPHPRVHHAPAAPPGHTFVGNLSMFCPPTTAAPPRGIFAPTPAPLPNASPASLPRPPAASAKPTRPRALAHSPSPSPAANDTPGTATPLPPRDASGRWRRKSDLVSRSSPATDPTPPSVRAPPVPPRRPAPLHVGHTHPARKHMGTTTPRGQVGSPPLTPTALIDASPHPSNRPPHAGTLSPPPPPPPPPVDAGTCPGLVQLPPAPVQPTLHRGHRPRTLSSSASSAASLSDVHERYAQGGAALTMHPTPSSSDELTDAATSESETDATSSSRASSGPPDDMGISSDTCALCRRHAVPPPSKLPAIVAQSPFTPAGSATSSSSTHWAGCDFCPRWYHCACLGVPPRIVGKLAQLACPPCAALHGHASKVKEKEAKRVATEVGDWVQRVYAARMARRPAPPVKPTVSTIKQKHKQRRRVRQVAPDAAGRDVHRMLSEPVVAYAVPTAGAMVYMDRVTAGSSRDDLGGGGGAVGDVISLPPLARRGRTRVKPAGAPMRAWSNFAVSVASTAHTTDAESGSGSDADTDGECDEDAGAVDHDLDVMDTDVASECDSTYAASVCSGLFVGAPEGHPTYLDPGAAVAFPAHYLPSSGLARRSLSPSEATEVEYSRPASPEPTVHGHGFAMPSYAPLVSPLDTLLAAANVVAVADAAASQATDLVRPPSSASCDPLASLASVASMMLSDAKASPDPPEHHGSESVGECAMHDGRNNMLRVLADSAWAASNLSLLPASPPATEPGHVANPTAHLPPTPVSASESDAGHNAPETARQCLKRPRDDDLMVDGCLVACTTDGESAPVDTKRIKLCMTETESGVGHAEQVEMATFSSL